MAPHSRPAGFHDGLAYKTTGAKYSTTCPTEQSHGDSSYSVQHPQHTTPGLDFSIAQDFFSVIDV